MGGGAVLRGDEQRMSIFSKKPKDQSGASGRAPDAKAQLAPQAKPNASQAKAQPGVNGAAKAVTPPGRSPPPTQEEVKQGMERAQATLIALGEIVSVMMRSPQHRSATLAGVQNLAAPAIATGQFMVARVLSKQHQQVAPVALILWADVSEEVDAVLTTDLERPMTLRRKDWTSGSIRWLVTSAGDPRAIAQLIAQLQKRDPDKAVKARIKDKDGKTVVHVFEAGKEAAVA